MDKAYRYSLYTLRRSIFLSIPDVSNFRNALGMRAGGGDVVAQFIEALVQIAGSIPDGVNGIFISIIFPAALWPWGRLRTRNIFCRVKAAGVYG